jgi:hypothetical protein
MEREHRAIPSAASDFAALPNDPRVTSGQITLHVAVVLIVIRGRHQHADVPTQDLGFGVTEQSLRTAIECLDAALSVDDDDAVNVVLMMASSRSAREATTHPGSR